ncbi:MAG: UDP-N-acetylmuramoyl-tripeptide--D-alanyl-D-alanine ligase, partial [Campylobacteraceae bacterium]|nr:UDP-N-acetylmuramoyl-tripeptide--D-alanyl-D-alanine ligase [Campylobacteraceae bacterium]
WYSYRIKRIIFHFHKPWWHFIFFIAPIVLYYALKVYFVPILILYLVSLYFWYKKLDKPLLFTKRVQRFFIFLIIILIFQNVICLLYGLNFVVLIPLVSALFISYIYEKIVFNGFRNEAVKKIKSIDNLKIIAITASYGKTSIKNFLHHILENNFKTYKTPKSVNTLGGLVLDVNNFLPHDTELYIVEAGAREKGDIKEIADFLEPQITVVGQIGAQHLEYFRTLENIRNTKMELLSSKKLEIAFVHTSANANPGNNEKVVLFGDDIVFIEESLDGIKFGIKINEKTEEFETSLLGSFNAINLSVCIKIALYLGLSIETIRQKIKTIRSVEHRLQRIDAGGKIIIDDSFNGNFEGMKSSYNLAKKHNGEKVLVTPGIIESSDEENAKLAEIMDDVFDLIIITGSTNMEILDKSIKNTKKILLKDKSKLTEVLAKETKAGDLILFSNDSPTYM